MVFVLKMVEKANFMICVQNLKNIISRREREITSVKIVDNVDNLVYNCFLQQKCGFTWGTIFNSIFVDYGG